MKRILFFLLTLLFTAGVAYCENFYIENYKVDINVKEDNVLDIKETIYANFTHPSHGIIRNIPMKNYVTRQDGTKELNHARISNIRTEDKCQFMLENGNYNLKLGNPDKLITGYHKYVISYSYKLPKDKMKDKDELYFNIIGTDWNTDINQVKFKITMPKEFDPENVGLSVGRQGTSGHKGRAILKIKKEENVILGKTIENLSPKEAVTIRVELPQGYFHVKTPAKVKYFVILLSLFFGFISYLSWYIWGKDDKVIPVVNFYPPKNINSAALGVLYRGSSDIKDVVSLIVYLASKGYIKIRSFENDFKFEKLKDYTGSNEVENKMMKSLFAHSDTISKYDLKISRNFYKDCFEIQMMLDKLKEKIYEKKSISFSAKLFPLISIISLFILFIYVIGDYFIGFDLTYLVALGVLLLTSLAFGIMIKQSSSSPVPFILPIFGLFFHGVSIAGIILLFGMNVLDNICSILLIYACIFISCICLYQMPKRNKFGIRVLGSILGFKKFIEAAEKKQLETLIEQDPAYCFDVLPFAYVLGVVDKWIKNIEDIALYNPSWYAGSVTDGAFVNFADSLYNVTIPSVDNGGVSTSSSGGGGGFSGGGSGGGGGSSW